MLNSQCTTLRPIFELMLGLCVISEQWALLWSLDVYTLDPPWWWPFTAMNSVGIHSKQWTWLIHTWIKNNLIFVTILYWMILFSFFFIVLVYLDLCIKILIQVTIHYIDLLKLFMFNFFGVYFDYFHWCGLWISFALKHCDTNTYNVYKMCFQHFVILWGWRSNVQLFVHNFF